MFVKRLFIGLGILVSCSQGFGWGATGHEIVSYSGAALASGGGRAFWGANVSGMRQLSTVPDRVWKSSATYAQESSNHWFQVDNYYQNYDASTIQQFPKVYAQAVSQYGADVIIKNGTAPWRIVQLYQLAVAAFRSGRTSLGLQYAGTMSHYIGDLSQPLHVSENFDGADTGQSGIHAWFETTNIQNETAIRARVMQEAQQLLSRQDYLAETSGSLMTILFNEIARSIAWRDTVLANDKRYGRVSPQAQSVQLQLAVDRMADGAAVLSIVLDMMWADVGQNLNATPIPVTDPSWVTNDYMNGGSTSLYPPNLAHEDDCGAI